MKHLLCVLTLLLLAGPVFAQAGKPRIITGTVVKVYDGDAVTVQVANGRRRTVRLAGIDAPEVRGHQPYWQQSRDKLRERLLGQQVSATIIGRDTKWKRDLAIVTHEGADVGRMQIAHGLAWYYRQYGRSLNEQQRIDYAQAEKDARQSRLNIFSSRAVPPWQWRRGVR